MPSKKKPAKQAPPPATDGDEHPPILEPAQQTRLSKLIPISSIDFSNLGRLNDSLKSSIEHIGLLNPITVAPNLDKQNKSQPYKLIAGRSRLKAYLELDRKEISATILELEDTDTHDDRRRQLATLEENVVRRNLPLIELCEQLGACKAIYDELYGTGWGKASPNKDPGAGSLPYVVKVAQDLKKSRSAVANYLKIYKDLILAHQEPYRTLKSKKHPILESVTDLLRLSQQGEDIPEIVGCLFKSDNGDKNFRSLEQALNLLESRKDREAREKGRQEEEEKARREREEAEAKRKAEAEEQQKAKENNGRRNNSSPGDDTTEDTIDDDKQTKPKDEPFNYDTYLENLTVWNDSTYEEISNTVATYGINAASIETRLEALKDSIQDNVPIQDFAIGDYRIHTTTDSVVITFRGCMSPDEWRDRIVLDCPGFGLYHPESETCNPCPAKLECLKAQMSEYHY